MNDRRTSQDISRDRARDASAGGDEPEEAPSVASESDKWSLHYRQGFEEGRRMAVEALLRSLLSITEEFIAADAAAGAELREIVYRFEEHLERRIWSISRDEGVVEGGLGI